MQIISFDIGGKMAHFRKYYANNTAMSYSIPPRTTIIGMLAAMLGVERDSYYEDFASERLRVGIRLLTPVKKTFHRLNLLRLVSLGDTAKDDLGDFTGASGRIQTPFELVSGYDLKADFVVYRVYVSCYEAGEGIFNQLKDALSTQHFHYNITLGVANFSAYISNFKIYNQFNIIEPSNDLIAIHSAVASTLIQRLDPSEENLMNLEEELLPLDFKKGQFRELSNLGRFLFSKNADAFKAVLKCRCFALLTEGGALLENIVFLEK